MSVLLETKGPSRKELKIEVPADEVKKAWDEVTAVFVQGAQIKGFRLGKAPKDMVVRQYGKKIREEVRDYVLPNAYREALKEQGLEPAMVLDLQEGEINPSEPFSFTVLLDVVPEFTLPPYKGIEIDSKTIKVSDKDVVDSINQFRERSATYVDAPEGSVVQPNDMVVLDYTATLDGKPLAEVSEKAKSLGSGTDFYMIANEEYSAIPGVGPALVGMKVGDVKDIETTFDERFTVEELRGKNVVFNTTVKKIRSRVLPAMDEAFFKRCQVKDEEELKTLTREGLVEQLEKAETQRRQGELLDKLMGQVEMELPASIVQEETQRLVYDIVRENTYRGASEDAIKENREKIFESAEQSARDRVKIRYILQRIAQEEKVVVSDAEVTSQIAHYAMQQGVSARDWFKRIKQEEHEVRDSVRKELRDAKTLDLLLKNAKIKE